MKELTTYNRAAGYLNTLFDLLNVEFFENKLKRPTLTIQSTPKAYGHFSLGNVWVTTSTGECTHEINIGAGTLNRPIENVVSTLLHEMVHYWNFEQGVQDCSRSGSYHNARFREAAEARGLIITHSDQYGWSHTEPGEPILDFCIKNQLQDIQLMRDEGYVPPVMPTGTNTTVTTGAAPTKTSSTRKYVCPCCGQSCRGTKILKIYCGYCNQELVLA